MDVSTEEKNNVTPIEKTMSEVREEISKEVSETEEIQNKIKSLKTLSSINDLILRGTHPGFNHHRIAEAEKFINSLYKQLYADLMNHPNKELAMTLIEQNMTGAANGQ